MQRHVQDDWEAGLVSREDLDRFRTRCQPCGGRRNPSGTQRKPTEFLDPEEPDGDRQTFKHFPALLPAAQRLCLCFISSHYDFYTEDSALSFERDLAHDAARRGHHVHVITMGTQEASVDFENGVWVHRVHDTQKVPKPVALSVPLSVWDPAYRMFREVERIGSRGQIHFLQWSILGLEGIAALLEGRFVNVVSLDVPDATDTRVARDSTTHSRLLAFSFTEVRWTILCGAGFPSVGQGSRQPRGRGSACTEPTFRKRKRVS